jgi:hypothetical protein
MLQRYFSPAFLTAILAASCFPPTGVGRRRLSAAGLTGVPAAAPAFPYLDKVIAEYEIEFSAQRHRRRHVGEESAEIGHILLRPHFRPISIK